MATSRPSKLPVFKLCFRMDRVTGPVVEIAGVEAVALKRAKEMSWQWPGYVAIARYPDGKEVEFLNGRRVRAKRKGVVTSPQKAEHSPTENEQWQEWNGGK